jgi:murein DD-endopeptidase MepM/ murein hydrolase activator NlpD
MPTNFSRAARGFSKAHYLLSVAATLMLAACSQSVDRFAENPSDADPVYTASVPKETPAAANAGDETITSRPLAGANIRKPGTGYSYSSNTRQPAYKAPQAARSEQPIGSPSGSVTVGPGMTLYSIARSNNLTVAELAAANRLKPPYSVRQGQVLRVPGVAEAVTPTARAKSMTAEPAMAAAEPARKINAAGSHRVASGETLFSLGRKFNVSPYAIADLNGLSHKSTLSLGQSVKIPGGSGTPVAMKTRQPAETQIVLTDDDGTTGPQPAGPAKQQAVAEQIPAVKTATQTQQVADAGQGGTAAEPDAAIPADASSTGMRWPVRGKIISAYGAKPNGLKNEGINIAVPEGTSIRAAESGVVAYSGNELKGYGNLVLIRHDGGWVTAYAHAKELFVKRGDTVKRGDVIAKAGQTGSVSSPQLHFEVRKGATAMDPLKFLGSATASN